MELINPKNLVLSPEQLAVLMPYLVMSAGALVSLFVGVMKSIKSKSLAAAGVAMATLGATAYTLLAVWGEPSQILFNNMMVADHYTNLFNLLFVLATALVLLSSYNYLEKEGLHHAEYYSLLLFGCLGMMLLTSALDLIVLFVALEIMSLAVYVLVGFRRADVRSNEAALKYFILGGAASAILLYGAAFIYGGTGSLNIDVIAKTLRTATESSMLTTVGAVLLVGGFLFKVAVVPFHMWMPDVYEGAPITVTNFMTTGLKAAAFAAFARVFGALNYFGTEAEKTMSLGKGFHDSFWIIAVVTMFVGNVIALTQKNLKRMLAYSSIAHSGYLLVAFIAGPKSEFGVAPVILYLFAYVLMNAGAFTVLGILSEKGDEHTTVEDFAGLAYRHPALAVAMTVFMFSMAGVPPTFGFAGKYLIFSAAVQAGEIWLAVLAVLCSAISAYYYLRVIVYMYMKEPTRDSRIAPLALPSLLAVALTAILTLQFGIFPAALIEAAKKAAHHL